MSIDRNLRGEVLDEVESLGVAERVEELRTQRTGAFVERDDSSRSERAADEVAEFLVARRIHEDHQAREHLVVRVVTGAGGPVWIDSSTVPRAEL